MIAQGMRFFPRLGRFLVRNLIGTITRISTTEPVVALTFDDGPHPEFTPQLLDLLAKYDASATFFMVGKAAQKYPDLIRRVAGGGHAIGNHSWDHPSFPLITRAQRREQLHACQQVLRPFAQPLFRPPYCEQSVASHLDALTLGYRVIAYDVSASDWCEPDPQIMTEQLLRRVRPGSIVLLHDTLFMDKDFSLEPPLPRPTHEDRAAMFLALEAFLERMRGRYRFVTVPALLRCGRPERQNWYTRRGPG